MRRACYFGIYDPKHWRTRLVTKGLIRAGYEVVECRVDPRQIGGWRKYEALVRKFREVKDIDLVVVGFPGYLAVIVARMLTRRTIIFDAYISYLDGIRDRKNYPVIHPLMWVAWLVDFIGGVCANVVLTINHAYREFFVRTLFVSSRKMEVLHKGADEAIFYPRPDLEKDNILIGWWGSYIPLHGLDVIIEAARILKDERMSFNLIGGGQLRADIEAQTKSYSLKNINFQSFIPQGKLVVKVANFDIVLGIFSPEPKALRCVTNKVYEAMAMGKAIITENSPANKEIFTHKNNVYMVEPGNPDALSEAIRELAGNAELRNTIGQNARKLFEERFTVDKIEEEFLDIISRHR